MPKPVVLIIDDEPDLCELLSITLQRMNLTPRTANSIAAGRRLLKAERFDLCLTACSCRTATASNWLSGCSNIRRLCRSL